MPFDEWADLDPLVLPIHGTPYTIPEIGWRDELRLRAQQASTDTEPISDEEFLNLTLGAALDQMRADNVPGKAIVRAALVAHVDALYGRAVAEHMWREGPSPEALAASMKAASGQGSTRSPNTDAADAAQKRASTSGTTSPKATRRAAATKPRRSTRTPSTTPTRH